MKTKLISLLPLILVLSSPLAHALTSDKDQPIYIDSDSQNLDLKNDTVIFTGNVFLRQGSIRLKANKVVITRTSNKADSEIINAYGSPSTFEQTMDDGEKINGRAEMLRYDVAKSMLTMSTNAMLIQGNGNKIESEKITYNIGKQLLAAESNKGQRVTTILQPQSRK